MFRRCKIGQFARLRYFWPSAPCPNSVTNRLSTFDVSFNPGIGWMRMRQHGCQFRAAACLAHWGCGTFETMILHQFRSQCAHSCGKKIACDSRGSKDARSEPAANGAFAKPFHSSIAETGPLDRSGGALEYPNELCDTESIIARSFLRVTGKEVN